MVITVSPGQSIQTAVDAARDGDTVFVRVGTYRQHVKVGNKARLRIEGEDTRQTILDGTGLGHATGLHVIHANLATISGFTVRGFDGCGIQIESSPAGVVRNNIVANNRTVGIGVHDADHILVEGNIITGNGSSGILLENTRESYVIANDVSGNTGNGIDVDGHFAFVTENKVEENGAHGIRLAGNGHWAIKNSIRGNGGWGICGGSDGADDLFVYGNVSGENEQGGLKVFGVGHAVIRNEFKTNRGQGVACAASDLLIYANMIEQNAKANIHGSSSFTRALVLSNRIITSGAPGIDPAGGEDDRILCNDVIGNAGSGIEIESTGRHLIDDNRIEANADGGVKMRVDAVSNAIRANKLQGNEPFDIEAPPPANTNNTVDLNEGKESFPPGLCS